MSALLRVPVLRRAIIEAQSRLFQALYADTVESGVRIYGWPIIGVAKGGRLHAGRRLVLISDPIFSEPGVAHPCVLRCLRSGAQITIGDDVGLSGVSICAEDRVIIGDQVLVGANAVITDTDFHPLQPASRRWNRHGTGVAPVTIGTNAFLGMNSMVLKGVSVGRDAVVAAGSIVVDDVPPGAIVAGAPARVVAMVPGYAASNALRPSSSVR